MSYQINVAIQLLPVNTTDNKIAVIDKAIRLIQESGLRYLVCPFETVVEGDFDTIMMLIKNIQTTCLDDKTQELIFNLKIHTANYNLSFSDKLVKYTSNT